MRLFFAVELPDDAKERLAPILRAAAAPGVSAERPAQIHFTLAFLGEQPEEAVERAARAAEAARELPAFSLAVAGAGAFPSERRPRVLWLGVSEGARELCALADKLCGALRAAGFLLEERPFRPHLTLGRVRPGGDRTARRVLAAVPAGELARMKVEEIQLMRSVLGAGGARHVVLRSFKLR